MEDAPIQLYVHSNPNKGAERFIEMVVTIDSETSDFLPSALDRKGRETFDQLIGHRPVVAQRGTLHARWKSPAHREACKEYQTRRGRWQKVKRYSAQMLAGDNFPPPVFLHPSITGGTDGLLMPIDGTRRIMACLEAGIGEIPVLIIRLRVP